MPPISIPPKTPVSIELTPKMLAAGTPKNGATTPIVASMTKQPTTAASEATPSLFARPSATGMAKTIGGLLKPPPPACAIRFETPAGIHEKFAEPTPSRMPAAGSTETGSISDRPIFCRMANAFFIDLAPGVRGRRSSPCQRADVSRRRRRQRRRGQRAALPGAQRAHALLDCRHHRHAHAQLLDAEADQDRHRLLLAGQAAADRDVAPVTPCRAHREIDQVQDRRVQRVELRRQR